MLEDQYTYLIITHLILPRMWNVSGKSRRENQNTHFMFSNFFWEIMWKNIVMLVRPQMTVWHMAHFTLVPKATNTHTLRICNTNCFSSATMVALMHLCYSMWLALLSNMWSKSLLQYSPLQLRVPFPTEHCKGQNWSYKINNQIWNIIYFI